MPGKCLTSYFRQRSLNYSYEPFVGSEVSLLFTSSTTQYFNEMECSSIKLWSIYTTGCCSATKKGALTNMEEAEVHSAVWMKPHAVGFQLWHFGNRKIMEAVRWSVTAEDSGGGGGRSEWWTGRAQEIFRAVKLLYDSVGGNMSLHSCQNL